MGIWLLAGVMGLAAQEFSVFYIASPNGTLTWCRCPDDPYGGLPRRASALKELRANNPSLLILDAGDLLAPFPSRLKDSVLLEAYRRIPVDVVAFGDQELIDGYDFFASRIRGKLPIISLNLYRNGSRLLGPYLVREVNGIKMVITSLINKNAFLFYEPKNLGGVEIREPSSELRSLLPELEAKGDVIILLSHLGIEEERKVAQEFPEIDIIVSGHTPALLAEPEVIGKTYILGAGQDGKHFGLAGFRFQDDSLLLLNNKVSVLSDKYPEDPAIQRIVAPYIEGEDVQVDSSLIAPDTGKTTTRHSPVVIDLFYAPDCDHCVKILKTQLPRLAKRHPGLFTLKLHNIDKPEEFLLLEQWEDKANDHDNDIPVLFFEGRVLGGEEEVGEGLEKLLLALRPDYSPADSARYAGQDVSWNPDTSTSFAQDTVRGVAEDKKEIVFFSTYGCNECDRVLYLLKGIAAQDSSVVLRVYGTEDPASKALLAAFDRVYNLPESKRLLTPAVFVGRGYLVKSEIDRENLARLLSGHTEPIPWAEIKKAEGMSHEVILEKFEGFRILPIVGAGLLDGINPCAFATLIFFITYLSVLGVERRRILLVAIPFILSVFLTYFVVGLVAYQILALLKVLHWVSVTVFGATVVFLLVLAVLSFNDYLLLRRGQGEKMKLKLPDRIRKRLNKIIRQRTTLGGFVVGAVVTGFLVSVFELVCTGQVYLPTLVYMAQVSEFKGRALLYLFIYNLAFILPLVVVFVLVRFGMTEKHLQMFLTRRAGLTKILTALLFLVLAGLMAFFLLRGLL